MCVEAMAEMQWESGAGVAFKTGHDGAERHETQGMKFHGLLGADRELTCHSQTSRWLRVEDVMDSGAARLRHFRRHHG